MLDIWKAGAPAIDFAAPDIYDRKSENVALYLDYASARTIKFMNANQAEIDNWLAAELMSPFE